MVAWWKVLAIGAGAGLLLLKRFMGGKICRSQALMIGKTIIITGGNCGIGKATACELVKRKARVILACRDVNKGNQAVSDIRKTTQDGELVVKELDLGSLASIRKFSDEILKELVRIDVLINNAGVYGCPFMRTSDGFEMQMGVNHLGHFLLTNLLIEQLKASAPSRIVVVSSGLHKFGKIDFENLNYSEQNYDRKKAYSNSKLANNLFARELARRLGDTGLGVHCVHPGMVNTNLGRYMNWSIFAKILLYPLFWLLVKTPWQGCQTVLHCTVAEELEGVTGHYYGNCKEEPWSELSMDDGVAKKLWEVSEKLTGLA